MTAEVTVVVLPELRSKSLFGRRFLCTSYCHRQAPFAYLSGSRSSLKLGLLRCHYRYGLL